MANGGPYIGISDGQHVYVYLSWSSSKVSGNTYKIECSVTVSVNTSIVPKGFIYINIGSNVYNYNVNFNGDDDYYYSATVTVGEDGKYRGGIGCGAGNSSYSAWATAPNPTKVGPANYSVTYIFNDGNNGSKSYDGYDGTNHTVISTIPSYNGDYDNTTTYKIIGDANGATGVSNTSITATKRSYSIHTFLGWSITNGAASASYTSGSTITINESITLYGVWNTSSGTTYSNCSIGDMPNLSWPTESTGYTVRFDANASTASVSPTTISSGKVTTHDFLGWHVSPTASSPASNDIELWEAGSFYAVWDTKTTDNSTIKLPTPTRENDTQNVEVSLDGNGGTTTTKSISTSIITTWTFKGWSDNNNASSGITGQYTPTGDVTLYATWSSSKSYPSVALPTTGLSKSKTGSSYKTYLDPNGGTHNISYVSSGITTSWTFNYWSDSRTGSSVGTSISANDNYSKLYAIWKTTGTTNDTANLGTPSNTVSFTVRFNANGGSVSPTSKSISGYYSFQGWYTSRTGGTKVNTQSYLASSNGNTLYARWSSSPSMTGISLPNASRTDNIKITFDPNGGIVSPTSKNVKASYTFKGWSESTSGSTIVSSTNYITTSGITLNAVWSSSPSLTGISIPTPSRSSVDGTFTITLNGNGGTLPSNITNPIEVDSNTSFTFAGWSTESDNSNKIITNTSNYTSESDQTLYAIWTPDTDTSGIKLPTSGIIKGSTTIDTYKIILNPIDGSVSVPYLSVNRIRNYTFKGWSPTGSTSNMVNSNNYIPTTTITLKAAYNTQDSTIPADLPDAIKTDHTFLGWSTVEDDTNYVSKRYTPTDNITLYANYLANYRASLWIWYNGKWNKCIVNLFTGDRFNTAE